MCKFAAIVLSGVVSFFFAWLCVFFTAGDVDVFTWKVETRFMVLVWVLSPTFLAAYYCKTFYKNK